MSRRPCLLLVMLTVFLAASPVEAEGTQNSNPKIDFAHDILPILKARCAECHTNGKYKASLSLDTREDLLKARVAFPGKSADSELLKRVLSNDPEIRMPPKGDRLSVKEVALLKAWVDQGLRWQAGFSFKTSNYAAPLKPRRPTLPVARAGREHPIDRLVDEVFAGRKMESPPDADDVTFIRRLFLDAIGLLPTPAEVDAFLHDPSPRKRTNLAERVLGDQRAYAEHWLTFWNDLLRNDYAGTGYIDGGRKQISGWLYRSLLENKTYDQFVRELISPTPDSEGFILGIKWRGNVNASQVREVQFSQNVAQVFFGSNLKCASCHDSFIDHWKLTDAYGLAAVIAEKPLEIHRCDKATGTFAVPRFMWPELGSIDAKQTKAKRLEQLALLVTHPDNGRFTRTLANRLWQRLLGRGLVHPVDAMANRPWNEDLLDYLGTYLAENSYDVKKLLLHIMTSRAYQARTALVANETVGQDYQFSGPEIRAMTAEQFLDTLWQITGTAPVKAAAPVSLAPFDPAVTPEERRFLRTALMKSDALMRALGRPNREQVVTTRPDVLTTLQALELSNGQVLADLLSRGAANLRKVHSKASPEQLIETLYRRALSRPPSPVELSTALELVGTAPTVDSLADLLWCLVMLPEYQLVR